MGVCPEIMMLSLSFGAGSDVTDHAKSEYFPFCPLSGNLCPFSFSDEDASPHSMPPQCYVLFCSHMCLILSACPRFCLQAPLLFSRGRPLGLVPLVIPNRMCFGIWLSAIWQIWPSQHSLLWVIISWALRGLACIKMSWLENQFSHVKTMVYHR